MSLEIYQLGIGKMCNLVLIVLLFKIMNKLFLILNNPTFPFMLIIDLKYPHKLIFVKPLEFIGNLSTFI